MRCNRIKSRASLLLALACGTLLDVVWVRATVTITQLGQGGWFADDSRDANGVDLVGLTLTPHGKPGQAATAADDLALKARMYFTDDPSTPNGLGALGFVLDSATGKASKSTLSLYGDFGAASQLAGGGFYADYEWMQPVVTSATRMVFRIALRTALWGTGEGQSQAGFTATRSGESEWDVILVYVPPAATAGVWTEAAITSATSGWKVYFQAGNTFWSQHYGLVSAFGSARSLDEWAAYDYDPNTPGLQSFLDGAEIVGLQFGLGSSTNAVGVSYLASFETSLLSEGYAFAAVPEPATNALLAGALALGLVWLCRCHGHA
jgi:hypothetical protein